MSLIHIAIADDHPMVITGIKDMLATARHIAIDATFLSGEALLQGLDKQQPDVLLLDIRLPDQSAEALIPLILQNHPCIRILILTNFDSTLYVHAMLNAGAHGYLLKNTDKDTLVKAIEMVNSGEVFLKPETQIALEQFRKSLKKSVVSRHVLTPRERDILKLIANGDSNQDIASQLHLSIRTVENYRLNLSIKLEVKNTAGLVMKAVELGLVNMT